MLNILSHSCRTSLDFRLYEKRFIFRQMLSIYDSKQSDHDTKLLILNLLHRTCHCKYALVELIKRHYLLLWLTSVLESLNASLNVQQSLKNSAFELYNKMLKIYNLIWQQLSNKLASENKAQLPITFLNQMHILTKVFHEKLIFYYKKINLLRDDRALQKTSTTKDSCMNNADEDSVESNQQISCNQMNEYEADLKEFIQTNQQLEQSMKSFDFGIHYSTQ